MRVGRLLAAGTLAALALVIIGGCVSDQPRDEAVTRSAAPSVFIGEATWTVELAQTPAQRTKGLSGRESMPPRTGMLFVHEAATALTFWMRGMRFPLDFVWIGEDCTVVGVTADAQPPASGTPDSALRRYRSGGPVLYNLEINAGEAQEFGIRVGDQVRFSGISSDGADC